MYAGSTGKVLGAFQDEEEIRPPPDGRAAHTPSPPAPSPPPRPFWRSMPPFRKQGYAISDGELNIETIGIGAPVRDESGNVWAAISISAPPGCGWTTPSWTGYIFLVTEIAAVDVPGSDPGNGWRLSEINGNITDDSFLFKKLYCFILSIWKPEIITQLQTFSVVR